jgi:hypothetical protein
MTEKYDNKKDDYYCKTCVKKYKTYKTLWEHNKKFHCSPNVVQSTPKLDICIPDSSPICIPTNSIKYVKM